MAERVLTDEQEIVVVLAAELAELVPEYLDIQRGNLASARTLLDRSDLERLATIGHRLKGSGGGYGLDGLSEIGAELEKAAAEGDLERAGAACDRWQQYLDHVRVEKS